MCRELIWWKGEEGGNLTVDEEIGETKTTEKKHFWITTLFILFKFLKVAKLQ